MPVAIVKTKQAPAIKKSYPAPAAPPQELEESCVHDVYDRIAYSFSNTRNRQWPVVETFINEFSNSLFLDVGTGNGKYLEENSNMNFAIDFCLDLCNIAQSRNAADVLRADAINLPFKGGQFEFAISIAVIHHFASHERRVSALKEIKRVLRQGGFALVCVWAEQDNCSGDEIVPWTQEYGNETHFSPNDARGAQKSTNEILSGRFYHFYQPGELATEGREAGLQIDREYGEKLMELAKEEKCDLEDEYFDCDNYYCVFVNK